MYTCMNIVLFLPVIVVHTCISANYSDMKCKKSENIDLSKYSIWSSMISWPTSEVSLFNITCTIHVHVSITCIIL